MNADPEGIGQFARLKQFLEDTLGTRIDRVTRSALRESMREAALREAVRAA